MSNKSNERSNVTRRPVRILAYSSGRALGAGDGLKASVEAVAAQGVGEVVEMVDVKKEEKSSD